MWVAVMAVVAVVAGLAAGSLVIRGLNSAAPDRAATDAPATSVSTSEVPVTPAGSPARVAANSALPAVDPEPSATIGSTPATVADAPSALLPQVGPGLTEPGILLIVTPASDGSFDVVERIRMANAVSALTLRPALVAQAGAQFATATAAAELVQVSAGDQPVVVPEAKVGGPLTLTVADVDHFEVRYRLTDVTVRSTPSTAGRALAAIGPLTDGVGADHPVHVIAAGPTVLGLNCPLLPLSQQSCGRRLPTGPGVERELPWSLALTTVQFDLPLT